MTLGSGGISPQNNLSMSHDPGMGDLGASEGRGDEKQIGAVDEEEHLVKLHINYAFDSNTRMHT